MTTHRFWPLPILATLPFLAGCMESVPARPVLTCTDCSGLVYFGPPPPDPRVEMARILTGGLTTIAGAVVQGDVIKALGRTSGGSSSHTHIERETAISDREANTSVSSVVRETSQTSDRAQITSNTAETTTYALPD